MNKRVVIKVTINGVLTTDLDQIMPKAEVADFVAPYKTTQVVGGNINRKTEIKIEPAN